MAASYFLLLPHLSAFAALAQGYGTTGAPSTARYEALASTEPDARDAVRDDPADENPSPTDTGAEENAESGEDAEEALEHRLEEKLPSLSTREKIELAKPLVWRYMVPLFFVYLAGKEHSHRSEDELLVDPPPDGRVHDQFRCCADFAV